MIDSDLIKYLGQNIGRLETFDYFLILVMGVLIGFGAYFVIRSIYRQVIVAQEKLITIKDKTIEQHEQTLSSLTTEKAELEETNTRIGREMEKIRSDLQTQNKEHNQRVNGLVKHFHIFIRLVILARLGLLQLNMLHVHRARAALLAPYARFVRDVQFRSPADITKEIDDVIKKLFEVLNVINISTHDGKVLEFPDEVPDSVFKLVTVDIDRSRLSIEQDLHKIEPIISEQMDKIVKQIQAQPSK